jgi:hypothetical protein
MYKNTKITERITTQLRVETFNTFNHTQFLNPSSGISVPNPSTAVTASTQASTGRITNSRDARSIQLALKLFF